MKKQFYFAFAVAAALASCSSDDVVNETVAAKQATQTPIGFSVQRQNVTRSTPLENLEQYNFGVWAFKRKGSTSPYTYEKVMDHYLVGYSDGTSKGYKNVGTTWSNATDAQTKHTNHVSPWFYEKLGKNEYIYEGSDGFYKKTDNSYMSVNDYQYLRYWDLAFDKTNFYCYAPYNSSVTFTENTRTINLPASLIQDGYDNPQNSSYSSSSAVKHNLRDFMYAGVSSTNSSLSDVNVEFERLGAKVFIRFYENIPGWRVEIVNLDQDYSGTWATGTTEDMRKGIQAAPSTGTAKTTYYTSYPATITFTDDAVPTFNKQTSSATPASTNLMFKIPESSAPSTEITNHALDVSSISGHNLIPEKLSSGSSGQTYSYSPTIYYPVCQPEDQTTGFVFHVTYRIISEDSYHEVITVHNAEVFVPAKATVGGTTTYIAAWQNNTKYTYTFLITKDSNGTTDPTTNIDPTDPSPDTKKALYPIVFDQVEVEEWNTPVEEEYNISDNTNY